MSFSEDDSRSSLDLHAFGFSQHGFQLGPAGGEAVPDLITEGKARVDIAPLGIERFATHSARAT